MKQPFRVAIVGAGDAHTEALLANLSPAVLPRRFPDWRSLSTHAPDFMPELVAVLPDCCGQPEHPADVPVWPIPPVDLHGPAALLEAKLLEGRRAPQARLLGQSPAMARVRGRLTTTAQTLLPLLLSGENGTGKDLAALVAHELSPRCEQPFVSVNCGAIPVALAETEFFGCVRGAFTGAENRTGFCHQALGGTLFLDEVGEMPLEIQAKLLRVLESREVRRVGSSRVEMTDFRLICATNRDLAAEVRAGRFREDLYYRVNVLALRMPPLRERKEDLPLLTAYFLSNEALPRRPRVSARALAKMNGYDWPGNLRQLRNVVLRAAVLHEGSELAPEHLEWET